MKINSVNSSIQSFKAMQDGQQVQQRPKYNTVKITGYTSLALGVASGIAANRKKIKMHRYLAYAAGILALVHTGIVEWNHYKRKNKITG